MRENKLLMRYLTLVLVLILILIVLAPLFYLKNKSTQKEDISKKAKTYEEAIVEKCGQYPADLGTKKVDGISIDNKEWSPDCQNIGYSISWLVNKQDGAMRNLPEMGVYIFNPKSMALRQIPLKPGYNNGFFGGWYGSKSDTITIIQGKDSTKGGGATLFNIQTNSYSE